MSYSSNITGLSKALTGLSARISKLESFRKTFSVKGGRNTRVRQVGNNFIVSSDGEGGGTIVQGGSTACPLDILTSGITPNDPNDPVTQYEVSVRLGTIGGFAPANWQSVGTIENDESKYLYAEITANGKDISTVELKLEEQVDGCINTETNNPPQQFNVIIGAIMANENEDGSYGTPIKPRAISCNSITIEPILTGEKCWTWRLGGV